MLLNIKKYIERPEIKQLLSYSIFPDPNHVDKVVEEYKNSSEHQLFGLESEKEIVAIIGYRYLNKEEIEIMHLAVRPDCRGAGFGRGLLLELLRKEKPKKLIAETDEEAVDFYRNVGFEIVSVGEKYPGVERFKCIYQAEM